MARSKHSLIKLSGTIGGLTFVNSKRYRPHTRTPRGTHTAAPVNEVLETNSKKTKQYSPITSRLHHCFGIIGRGFKQSDLWQVIMSGVLKGGCRDLTEFVQRFKGLDLNSKYRFDEIVTPPGVAVSSDRKPDMRIVLENCVTAHFPKNKTINSYYYEVFIVWMDKGGKRFEWDSSETEWLFTRHEAYDFEFAFAKPLWAKYYLVVLKLIGGEDQVASGNLSSMRMQVCDTGTC